MFKRSSFTKNVDSFIAAIAGFCIIFLFTRHSGIGICPDGVAYASTAESLCTHGTGTDFTQSPMVNFPLFYPLFLSSLMWLTGLTPLLLGPFFNSLLFAIVIYLSGYIITQRSYASKWYKIALLSCIVFSPCLLEVYSMLWSETIFIILLLFFLVSIHTYFNNYSRKTLIAAAIITSIACITRYAGVTIAGAGVLFLLCDTKRPIQKKLADTFLFLSISSILLLINLIRNIHVSTTGTGNRELSLSPLTKNLHDTGVVFNDWLTFFHGHDHVAVWMLVFFIVLTAYTCIRQFRLNGRLDNFEGMAAAFSLLYVLFMLLMATITRFETLNSRFFSPVFILLLLVCAFNLKTINPANNKWLLIVAAIVFLCFQYGQLNADYETWDGIKDAGIPGYTEDQWQHSETVKFIQQDTLLFRKGYNMYSNAYDAVYFFTKKPGQFLPHKESQEAVEYFLNDSHCYMVWFIDGEDPDLVDINFITQRKKMKLVRKFNDGAVYEYDKSF